MGQKQTRCTLPDEAACESVDMSRDEAVLILLQHCRDMKRQETRLRLVSLMLLLSCVALFIFSQFQRNSGASGHMSTATPSLAYSKQDRECPAADPQTDTKKLQIDLTLASNQSSTQTMKWTCLLGDDDYEKDTGAIVIPADGIYSFYLRFTFRCHGKETGSSKLSVMLVKRNAALRNPKNLTNVIDHVKCRKGVFRTVSVMQLYDLVKGDKISVLLGEGRELITESSFGAFLT